MTNAAFDQGRRTCRLAMWSGPRNISTALMRAFENRADTAVVDEPFYAHYLKVTGLDHPGAAEVIAADEPNWERVVAALTGPVPGDKPVFYQKQMTHHLLPNIDRGWMKNEDFVQVFLIRDPAEMLTSLMKVLPRVQIEDTGVLQQAEIFDLVSEWSSTVPIVIDARDVLENPRGMLRALCDRVGIAFDEKMLRWRAGPRETDGVWAKWWYGNVNKSTEFGGYHAKDEVVPTELQGICGECAVHYERMHRVRLLA